MHIDFLRQRFADAGDSDALIWRDQAYSYAYLLAKLDEWLSVLDDAGVAPGSVVAVEADFSPRAIALMLALIERSCLFVPLSSSIEGKKNEFRDVAEVEYTVSIDERDEPVIAATGRTATHEIIHKLKDSGRPGLTLFSSGSTGKSKAAVQVNAAPEQTTCSAGSRVCTTAEL